MEIALTGKCGKCGSDFEVKADVEAVDLAPSVRANIQPTGSALVYEITSGMIEKFILDKATACVAGIKVQAVPIFDSNKKRGKKYAFIKVAFSDHAIDRKGGDSWYDRVAEQNGSPTLVDSLFNNVVAQYKYDRKKVEKWLKDYEVMETLEDKVGMTSDLAQFIHEYSVLRSIETQGTKWIFFAAAPENIIKDMMTDPYTGKPAGRIELVNTEIIAKDSVKYTVYLYPNETVYKENPHIRQILLGEEKPKK